MLKDFVLEKHKEKPNTCLPITHYLSLFKIKRRCISTDISDCKDMEREQMLIYYAIKFCKLHMIIF